MASIKQHGKRWRAQVCANGVRKSKVCETKAEAKDWAARLENEIKTCGPTARMTMRELTQAWVRRYPNRKSITWEDKRLQFLMADWLGDVMLADFNKVLAARWRDERGMAVQPGTVLRDWNLLSSVLSSAANEMGLIPHNPMHGVKRPEQPEPRSRLATPEELERIEQCTMPGRASWVALQMFKLAYQTGMSLGEICQLDHGQIDRTKQVAKMPAFKTRPSRDVPLTKAALEIIGHGHGSVFGKTASQIDVAWRKLCRAGDVLDLHFHDSRHMAATWMATRIDALALAKLLGHRDLKQLLNTYYKADASLLVKQLE